MVDDPNISYVKKDYNINFGIDIPKILTHHKVDDMHLYIAPEKISWIALDDIGRDFLEYFSNGFTIKRVIEEMKSKNFETNYILSKLQDFLIKIERKGFLETARIKAEEPKISLQLFITNKCNLRCVHCYMDSGNCMTNELKTDDFLSIIDDFAKIYATKVVFTGGEPLTRHDFFTLAKRAKDRNLEVILFTNGTLINETMIEKLERYVDEIQMSLDGASEEINDKIRGNGAYNKVLKAIRLLNGSKIRKRIAIVLMPQNVNSFKENVEEFSKSLENVDLKFSLATTEGRSNKSFRFKSEIEAENNIQFILEKLYSKRLNVVAKFEPNNKVQNCGYGEVISISSNGEVYPCAILKYKAGNINENKLCEIVKKIRHDSLASNVENLEKCPNCDLMYICFGGCRLNNITHNKNILIPFCNDEKKKNIYRKLVLRDQFDALSIWINQKNSEYTEELC